MLGVLMQTVIIVGCGDIGRRVAALYRGKAQRIIGLVQTSTSMRRLRGTGVEGMQVDLDFMPLPDALPTAGAVIHYYVPPPREGHNDPRLQRFLHAIPANASPQRVVYISTSAVYGNCHGEWVTEERPPQPDSDRGKRRLFAEQVLQAWCAARQVESVILRVPGIYGPGRLPIKRLKSGAPVVEEREGSYSNRIHADDLAQICLAAAQRAPANSIYNVSDGHPTTMTDYFLQVADLLELDPPPLISLDEAQELLSPAMLSFLNESKRLNNSKMLKELGIKLKYPTLKPGLQASLTDNA